MLCRRRLRGRALSIAVLLAVAVTGGVGCVGSSAGGDVPNTCAPDLSQSRPLRGAQPVRSEGSYRQADNGIVDPSFYLPPQVVSGGEQWRFGFATTVEAGTGSAEVRVEVDWYATPTGDNSGFLGHANGPWVQVHSGATTPTRVSHPFTAPAGAVRANVLTDMRAGTPDNTWTVRDCDYRRGGGQQSTTTTGPTTTGPTTTEPSTTATTTTPETIPTTTQPPPSTTTTTGPPPPPPGGEDTAAGRRGWGAPLPEWSDEFNYGSESSPAVPDQAKWNLAGGGVDQCWQGHDGNGRRCDKNTRVVGGVLRQIGEAGGDSGWLASHFGQQYGRWEARVRSQATSPDNGRQYHPLLILWPHSDQWPEGGEYDYLENMSPGEQCAEAFIHYPQDAGAPVQQEFAQRCGVDLTQWHNIAVEWTPDHVKGFVDGEEWFSFSGGANSVRQCIQCAPGMHQTIQLDNFFGSSMQSAVYEVDWARVYSL
jgi:hypothetical protein